MARREEGSIFTKENEEEKTNEKKSQRCPRWVFSLSRRLKSCWERYAALGSVSKETLIRNCLKHAASYPSWVYISSVKVDAERPRAFPGSLKEKMDR
jgi:hypothetical protein